MLMRHDMLVMKGLAYHHSGLPPDDRLLVEQLYIQGHIQGIPAHRHATA